jgi:hypothetical protein
VKVGQQDIRAHAEVAPEVAVAELVWNAIDADATEVRITTNRTIIDAPPDRLHVADNGTGIPAEKVRELLDTHRESWKRDARLSPERRRPMHGRNGRGRFRVYAIANEATWRSVAADGSGELHEVEFTGSASSLTKFKVRAGGTPISKNHDTGTDVSLRLLDNQKAARLGDTGFDRRLEVVLAPTLLAIQDVVVTFDRVKLDPSDVVDLTNDIQLDAPDEPGEDSEVEAPPPVLRIIEWNHSDGKPQLFLCDANGAAVAESPATLPKSPGITWTAYLLWDGFILPDVNEGDLLMDEMRFPVLKDALHELTQYLSQRADEAIDELVGKWRADDTYPYKEPPQTIIEEVEQRTFRELIGATRRVIPEAKGQRKMMLGLMQATLSESPSRLPEVMRHVRGLTNEQISEFADLLEQIDLPSIIRASQVVTDRVGFLTALEQLLFDPESRTQFLEKQQLHPLLEAHPWLFGAEWSIAASEVTLTNAYVRHLAELRSDEERPASVPKDARRIDLLFTAGVRDDRRHRRLVVELKRANTVLSREHRNQLQDYAKALTADNQFSGTAVDWDFWLIGTDIHDRLADEVNQKDRPHGLTLEYDAPTGRCRLWIIKWSELIDARRAELEFFQRQYQYHPTAQAAVERLRELHPDHVPNVGGGPGE